MEDHSIGRRIVQVLASVERYKLEQWKRRGDGFLPRKGQEEYSMISSHPEATKALKEILRANYEVLE